MFHRNTNEGNREFWSYKVIRCVQALEYKYNDDAACENISVKEKVKNY